MANSQETELELELEEELQGLGEFEHPEHAHESEWEHHPEHAHEYEWEHHPEHAHEFESEWEGEFEAGEQFFKPLTRRIRKLVQRAIPDLRKVIARGRWARYCTRSVTICRPTWGLGGLSRALLHCVSCGRDAPAPSSKRGPDGTGRCLQI
jgi:hypothetical protein